MLKCISFCFWMFLIYSLFCACSVFFRIFSELYDCTLFQIIMRDNKLGCLFFSKDFCRHCTRILTDRICSLDPDSSRYRNLLYIKSRLYEHHGCDMNSLGRWKDGENDWPDRVASDCIKPLHNRSQNAKSRRDRALLYTEKFLNNSRSYETLENCNMKNYTNHVNISPKIAIMNDFYRSKK